MSYSLHCTKKLLDRLHKSTSPSLAESTTMLGNWYATVLFLRPQLALFVNERTLIPVILPLAPAATLLKRFPSCVELILKAHGVDQDFIKAELAQMTAVDCAKTANRSVVGVMNQFSFLTENYQDFLEATDLISLSVKLSETPCSPLYKGQISPDRELKRIVSELRSS